MKFSELQLIGEKEAVKILGRAKVSLWRARRGGKLSYVRLGGNIYYRREDIESYINRGLVSEMQTRRVGVAREVSNGSK